MEAPAGRKRPEEAPATARRPLRADAQVNHDRLLEVAARHFAEAGSDASMKAIAREAGVGIGTLYRRFPTREILVEATYRSESRRLCEAAPVLLREMPPGDALREWMRMFLGYMAAKRGMAGALRVLLTADDDLRLQTRGMLIESLAVLLRAGAEAGTIRAGVDATDVVMALGGFASIIGEQQVPGLTGRLLDLLLHGLAAPGPATQGAAAATAGLGGAAAGPPSPGGRGKVHITDK
ncbi:MAG: TetR/AcrR family transcriptional regulator [Streptosporangiales bacterium]